MKFLFVGSSVMDVVAVAPKVKKINLSENHHFEKFACISFASKTILDDLLIEPGGSAANSAVAVKRLGGSSALLSAVGRDAFGKIIFKSLKESGVDCKSVLVKDGMSSVSVVLVDESGEKSVLVYKGVTDLLSPKDFKESLLKGVDVVVLCSLASKENFALFQRVISSTKRLGKKVVFAPSITMLRERSSELRKFHKHFDLVIMNLEEAFYYTREHSVEKAFKKLGGRVSVITADLQGSYAFDGRHAYHINAPPANEVDTTGAGDAFTGGFVHSFFIHNDIRKALQEASAVAGLKLCSFGARFKGDKASVEKFLKQHEVKLYVREI